MADVVTESLVCIPEVQLHEVNNGRQQLLEWGPLELSIHTFEGTSGLWIKAGKQEWSFDATTPVLKAGEHNFMFAMGGARFLSVLLAKATPSDLAAVFEEILVECTSFEYAGAMSKAATDEAVSEVVAEVVADAQTPAEEPELQQQPPSHKRTHSDRILSGAAAVQGKLLASANWASQKLLDQSRAMQARTEAGQPVNISPQMAARVKMARRAAETGNWAANKVAGGIADISIKLADSIVSRLGPNQEYGEQLANPETRPNAAKEVAAAAVVAAVGIYDSMEQAARLVLNSGGQATSEFIGHKYGQDAGAVVKDAASATVTTGMTAMTMQKIGVKKIARRIAKRTATGLAKAHMLSPSQQAAMPGAKRQQAHPAQQPQQPQQQHPSPAPQPGPAQMQHIVHGAPLQATQPHNILETAPGAIEYKSPFANES